ncbi:MAG TPA: hypothetical protein DDY78_20985 [Planctomycetales bacterium]|nr:hypothetical protein [Planctomycetales bacterium]
MKRFPTRLTLLAVFVAAAPLTAADSTDFFFKKGDRIVFLGDSITEQYQYSTDIELYLTTRFPEWNLTFINAGISGDTATGGASRFATHVLAEKPTAVTIDFGMNDGGYGAFDKKRAKAFLEKTETMLKAAKEAGVRVALISPNAVEVRNNPGLKTYLETQKEFYAPLKELADKYMDAFVDQYAVTRAFEEKIGPDNDAVKGALEKIAPENALAKTLIEKLAADTAVKAFPDGVHTGGGGALLMARTILVGLKAPAVVSDLEIDAADHKAGKATRCKADKVAGGAEGVSFERTDEALPLPVAKDWGDMLPYVDRLKNLNYYGLKVSGLKEGKYALSIDGKKVKTYAASDLAAGVNLGNLDSGPLFEQSEAVFKAINEKNVLVHNRFNDVVRKAAAVGEEAKRDDLKRRMDEIDARQATIYKLAQPKMHKFELKMAK